MTLGEYRRSVPKQYLLPASAFTSAEDIGRFKDVATAAGIKLFSMAAGVIVEDFDNRGFKDVMTSSFDMCAPMHLFRNNGDGTFEDRAAKAGLGGQLGGLNMIQADYNNDGCVDVLVLRGGWETPQREVAAAEQLQRHLYGRDQGSRADAAEQHADGGLGGHQQRRLPGSLRGQ